MTSPDTDASNSIRFVLDGEVQSVSGLPATTTLLEYLREHAHRTGTKEGCAEGDCGACTVVLGEIGAEGKLCYRAVNSCIRFLPTIDGKELVTVESLQDQQTLHPVQQALVDCHGSQCGFCTPGFVMSLFALYLNDAAPTRDTVVDTLSGNLCRCTGYRPIIDAGCHMHRYPAPQRWSREDAQSPGRVETLRTLQRETALQLTGYQAPRTIEEFAMAYAAAPQSLVLAGATDIGLWVTKHLRALPPLLYIGDVAELKSVVASDAGLVIGAAVSLSEAWQAIVSMYPQLDELAKRFASVPVCNSGTLVGNLANGSPIGDSMPALIALAATVELRCGAETRRLPLEALYLGYQKKDLRPAEFLTSVHIPAATSGVMFECYKLAKRIDQDISAVCAAFAVKLDGEIIASARIAYGGMAATPSRARATEAALIGQPWNAQTIAAAAAKLSEDYSPLSDMRASGAYRALTAANLLQRFYLQHAGKATALRTGDAAVVEA